MFRIEKPTQPDRCELCRHSICVTVTVDTGYVPVSLSGYSSGHWGDRYKTEERRVCKRFPPTAGDVGYQGSPFVGDGNWCGEFAQRGSQES